MNRGRIKFVPYDQRGEPVEPMPIEEYEALKASNDRAVVIAHGIARAMVRVELTLFAAVGLYLGSHALVAAAERGWLSW